MYSNMIPFAEMWTCPFFGFLSHIVYYAMLMKGSHWLLHLICHYPPPFLFGNHYVLCYVVKPFLFGKEVHLYLFLESTSKWYPMVAVFVWLHFLWWSLPPPFLWRHPFCGWVTSLCVRVPHILYPSSVLWLAAFWSCLVELRLKITHAFKF